MAATAAKCQCAVSAGSLKVECTHCKAALYIPDSDKDCDHHGQAELRRGEDQMCCGQYKCVNGMCLCTCDRKEDDPNLTPADTGSCDCYPTRCVSCNHWLFIVQVSYADCNAHTKSKTLREGTLCETCSDATCAEHASCRCRCGKSTEVADTKRVAKERAKALSKSSSDCDCGVSSDARKLECSFCSTELYVPDEDDLGEDARCKNHGDTRVGKKHKCCGEYTCRNCMCPCRCDRKSSEKGLTPADTGDCDCYVSSCRSCKHLLFMTQNDDGERCKAHAKSTKLREGVQCDNCIANTCMGRECPCSCALAAKKAKENEAELKKRGRSFELPLKAKGEGRPERKQIPKKAAESETDEKEKTQARKFCDYCKREKCVHCGAKLYIPEEGEGLCEDLHGCRTEGMYAECCNAPVCNNTECDCSCVICKCFDLDNSFTCGHCEELFRIPNQHPCNVQHTERLLTNTSGMEVCKQCFLIKCGQCVADCLGDHPCGPPPIGQEDKDEKTRFLAKKCEEEKAKAEAKLKDMVAAAKAAAAVASITANKKIEKAKVVDLGTDSDTESDTDAPKKAAAPAPAPAPTAAKASKMSKAEFEELGKRIEARKRKIADMQKKSAEETRERVAKAKKAKLDAKASSPSPSTSPAKAQ